MCAVAEKYDFVILFLYSKLFIRLSCKVGLHTKKEFKIKKKCSMPAS